MILKLSSPQASPSEIFKALVDREAEINWAKNNIVTEIPKVVKVEKVRLNAGLWNFIKNSIYQLRP